ncbi:RNA-guided endonuclease InsQ/TnpB family protein [Aggregatilinea lenta]|uniref:RNA-guided endonuclease InsQ/TnpB family protein n=1 Tax=Aggregatilinea lenta TaxID=913108 RepID=UPI000E5AB249|nr:RNA-guided endonuclease TnpB family protein [Aggregatilinea lenta]
MLRSYRYRLYPSAAQEKNLRLILDACRGLYNLALAERKYAYQLEGRGVSKAELYELARHYRQTFPYADQMFSQTAQSVIEQVDLAFQAFFRRVKAGETPGYPRFKGRGWYNSFLFKQFGVGAKLDGRRLKLFGIGRVRVRWHRPIEGEIKTVRIQHKASQWYACFACEVEKPDPLPSTGRAVGIDVGISALLTTSDGEKVAHPGYYRAGQQKLRVLQRKLARAQRGSQNRRKALRAVQRQQAHVAAQRADYLHKLSAYLVRNFDCIALEDLRVNNMVRNHPLSKSILDSGWSAFRQYLTYKAESAGREIAFVDPAYTSKCCSACGAAFQDFDLSTRWVECDCGLSLDRDHNAALNILSRAGWDTSVPENVTPLFAPSAGGQGQASVRSPRL